MTRYIDTERDVDVSPPAPEPHVHLDCLLCGHHDEFGAITLRVAWYREAVLIDGELRAITSLPRCLDVEACRSRVLVAGEAWPLLERGEQPKPATTSPDEAKETPDVNFI